MREEEEEKDQFICPIQSSIHHKDTCSFYKFFYLEMYLYYPQLKKRRRGKHDCNSSKDLSTLTSLLQQQQADYSHSIGGTSYYVALVNDKILIGDTHMI